MKKNPHLWYKLGLICAAFLFAAALQTFAFTEPAVAPPTNVIDAPLNAGATAQTKSGTLTVGSLVSNGTVGVGTASPSYKLEVNGDLRADGWLRTLGNTLWYSDTWGGGWYMSDATWIRAYNNKSIYTAGQVRGDAGLCIGGTCMTSWSTAPIYNCSGNPYPPSSEPGPTFNSTQQEQTCSTSCDESGNCSTSCSIIGTYSCPFVGYLAI